MCVVGLQRMCVVGLHRGSPFFNRVRRIQPWARIILTGGLAHAAYLVLCLSVESFVSMNSFGELAIALLKGF